jgi:hypothetical protein
MVKPTECRNREKADHAWASGAQSIILIGRRFRHIVLGFLGMRLEGFCNGGRTNRLFDGVD